MAYGQRAGHFIVGPPSRPPDGRSGPGQNRTPLHLCLGRDHQGGKIQRRTAPTVEGVAMGQVSGMHGIRFWQLLAGGYHRSLLVQGRLWRKSNSLCRNPIHGAQPAAMPNHFPQSKTKGLRTSSSFLDAHLQSDAIRRSSFRVVTTSGLASAPTKKECFGTPAASKFAESLGCKGCRSKKPGPAYQPASRPTGSNKAVSFWDSADTHHNFRFNF